MKKFLKILLLIIVIVFGILLILPFAFQGKLTQIAKDEINNQIDAKADFRKLKLSFISSFPNAEISLHDLSIIGIDDFERDTLSYIDKLSVKVGMMDVFKQPIEIKSILISGLTINALVLENGEANWDIAKETEDQEIVQDDETDESSSFGLRLKEFRIENANVFYLDKQTKMSSEIGDLNFFLSGDLSADKTTLSTHTQIEELSFTMDGIKYLNRSQLNWKADLETDLVNSKYTFNDNLLRLNALELGFDGWVAMPDENIEMDLSFQSKNNEFKQILSMIPAVYTDSYKDDFQNIKTAGKLSFDGKVHGIYNENRLPAFDINLLVDNARFQYPDLPSSVENIQIDLSIENKDGIDDHTLIDLRNFHMEMASNPFDMKMKITHPVSDPAIDGLVIGKIDLDKVKDLIPDDDMKIGGLIAADFQIKGAMSAIEQENYNDFHAQGNIHLSDFNYSDPDYPNGIQIETAQAELSPQYINLKKLKGKTGNSDFNMKGQLDHILAWYFKEDLLKGIFEFSSGQIFLADFMGSTEETEQQSEEVPEEEMSIIEIPDNIDFILISNIDKLIYDSLEIEKVKGKIILKDSKASLQNVSMNLLGGSMKMNGSYSSENIENPEIDFEIDAQKIDVKESFVAFNTIQKLAPIAKYAQGNISAKMEMNGLLQPDMEVDLKTLNSTGRLTSDNLSIKNTAILTQLTSLIKSDKFNQLALNNLNLSYIIDKGQLQLKPFDTKAGNSKMTIGGSQNLDQNINYYIDFSVPSSEFGSQANAVANQLLGEVNKFGLDLQAPETIKFKTLIGETLSDPKVSLDMKNQAANMADELKKQAEQKIKEEVDKAKQKAIEEAQKKADQLLADADKQGKKIIAEAEKLAGQVHQEAYKQADAGKNEAYKQADNLVREAGSDMIKKTLAQTAAEKMKKEADNTANKIKAEADTQKQKKIQLAKNEAQKLKDAAKKEGDALIAKAKK